uniref:Uncharacterized protein n=1 Tax=Salvator merianae TaxID=96440 RepID=A0A8D0DLH1_SALMN
EGNIPIYCLKLCFDFNLHCFILDLKITSENGLELTSSGSAKTETSKIEYDTDNTLGTEVTLEDQLAHGLKPTFVSSFSLNTGKKSAKVKSANNPGSDMDFDIAGPSSIHGAFVFGYEGWLPNDY